MSLKRIFMYMIINMGLTAGASVLTSQYWGRGDSESIRKTMSMTYKISLALSVIFMVAAFSAPEFILSIYTNDAEDVKLDMHQGSIKLYN